MTGKALFSHSSKLRSGVSLRGRAIPALLATSSLLVLWPVAAGARQTAQDSPSYTHNHLPSVAPSPDAGPLAGVNSTKLEHMREDDRRKRLMSDTAKLLQLSTELRAEVEKTTKDELSVDVVRKAAEIEKLAHDVKERMKS